MGTISTYDQPGVAGRIAHKQTGIVSSLDKLTADHLSTFLDEVLSNSTYRDNACKLQKAIAKANGLSVAADLVEESLGLKREPAGREASTIRTNEKASKGILGKILASELSPYLTLQDAGLTRRSSSKSGCLECCGRGF